jgi:hypothetical protein
MLATLKKRNNMNRFDFTLLTIYAEKRQNNRRGVCFFPEQLRFFVFFSAFLIYMVFGTGVISSCSPNQQQNNSEIPTVYIGTNCCPVPTADNSDLDVLYGVSYQYPLREAVEFGGFACSFIGVKATNPSCSM